MSSPHDPEGRPSLPRELADRLFTLMFGDPATRETGIDQLLADHPAHAEVIRARWQAHVDLERHGEAMPPNEQIVSGYRLLSVLGEGGMGTVYRAEQIEPLRRLVALKVIKPGMDSKRVLARFERERQSLAAMDHEAIAKVFDCGMTTRGHPYFAMELVPGLPLQRYCDQHRLPLPDRIRLFQQVCEGVQHAHQKGVIHRDLKPGNILVVERDGQPLAKIIDFGVARAADPELGGATLFTEQGAILGTPAYMSPEQAGGDGKRIDTRTDVYSLGVVLYELLVGALPFPAAELLEAGHAEILRRLREDEPPTPSRRLTSLGSAATTCAEQRAIDPEDLRRELARDLDWVVLRAMAKNPGQRYASAQALADDLGRYLAHEPLWAGPPTLLYRVRKFLRRHRGPVAAMVAVLVTALTGAVIVLQFALREQKKVREYELLSGVVDYEQVIAAEPQLHPAWPHQIPAMTAWLEDCNRLLGRQTELAQALRELQSRALPATAAEVQVDRATHPRFAEWQSVRRQLASLERAAAVRAGLPFVEPPLPTDLADWPAWALAKLAWDRVAPDWGKRTVPAEEPLGLACARAAAAKAAGTADEAQHLIRLAWALFANGLDAASAAGGDAAVAKATAADQEVKEQRRKLAAAIEGRATYLARLRSLERELGAVIGERRSWRFQDDDFGGRYLHLALPELVANLQHVRTTVVPDVERRLAWARQLAALQGGHPQAGHTWDEVRAALAKADGVVASRLYAGHTIDLHDEDVVGLVPIGANPVTRLWEFYDLRSAWDGQREAKDIGIPSHDGNGAIAVGDDTGIVFVLLPGGMATIGAQNTDKGRRHFDASAEPRLGPVHSLPLAPFFVARHELTQGQWARLWQGDEAGRHPSQLKVGQEVFGQTITLAHPVTQVSWTACTTMLARVGLLLPTEAQWEYACRAGAPGPWTCDRSELYRFANLADAAAKRAKMRWEPFEEWDDHFVKTAPVGSLQPNAFGLFDVHGNVYEWCRDEYAEDYTVPARAGDGLRLRGDGSRDVVARGGCCGTGALQSTAAIRRPLQPGNTNDYIGLRPVRALHLAH